MADWVCIFESFDNHEVMIKKALLGKHNIDAVVLNKKDSMYQFLSESSFIQLLVKPESVITAKRLIEKHNE